MPELSSEEVTEIFTNAGDSVSVIQKLASLSSLTDAQKAEIKRNVDHLELIKSYKKEDRITSIWTGNEDFSAQDAAVTLGKSKLI